MKVDDWPLKKIGDFLRKKKTGASLDPSKFPREEFELYSVPSFAEKQPEIVLGKEIGSNKQIINPNDVLLSKINPHLNRVWIIEGEKRENRMIGSSEWIQFPENPEIYSPYLKFFLSRQIFVNYCVLNATGVGGSLTRIKPDTIRDLDIPIPPLDVQKIIADKLDFEFGNLEEMEANLHIAIQNISVLKESLLVDIFGPTLGGEENE